jgi:chromosome partitioning protein
MRSTHTQQRTCAPAYKRTGVRVATIISIASAKGGVSKTTLSVGLATDLALEGYRTTIIDCDANQHAKAFSRKCSIDGFKVLGNITEDTLLAQLRTARGDSDIIILDLPGVTSRLVMMALQKSSFALIPCQPSLLDVRDAIRTESQIADAADLSDRVIPRALIWTCVPSGFESRVSKAVHETIQGRGIPAFDTCLMERTAYREMFLTGEPPRLATPGSPAAQNLRAISAELIARLTSTTAKTEAA